MAFSYNNINLVGPDFKSKYEMNRAAYRNNGLNLVSGLAEGVKTGLDQYQKDEAYKDQQTQQWYDNATRRERNEAADKQQQWQNNFNANQQRMEQERYADEKLKSILEKQEADKAAAAKRTHDDELAKATGVIRSRLDALKTLTATDDKGNKRALTPDEMLQQQNEIAGKIKNHYPTLTDDDIWNTINAYYDTEKWTASGKSAAYSANKKTSGNNGDFNPFAL